MTQKEIIALIKETKDRYATEMTLAVKNYTITLKI